MEALDGLRVAGLDLEELLAFLGQPLDGLPAGEEHRELLGGA